MLADLARRVLDTGDAVSAILLCLEALPDDAQKVDRPLVEAAAEVCYQALSRQQERRVFSLPKADVLDAVINDDGKRVMALTGKGARVWNAETGAQLASFRGSVIFHGDGKQVTSMDPSGIRVWNVKEEGPELVREFGPSAHPRPAQFLPITGQGWVEQEAWLEVCNFVRGRKPRPLLKKPRLRLDYEKLVFSADGQKIVTTPLFDYSSPTDQTIRIQRRFSNTRSLVDYAKKVVPRTLTTEQRRAFFLDADPPPWYIEAKKWPYRFHSAR